MAEIRLPSRPTTGSAAADFQKETVQQTLSTSQRLWGNAYEELAHDIKTRKIVKAYVKILAEVLQGEKTCDVEAEMKDPCRRQMFMQKLVKEGRVKHSTSTKVLKAVGEAAQFILSSKEIVNFAVACVPQAALPWAGVRVGLEMLSRPTLVRKSNIAGITHVISRMQWYCALTEQLLNKDNIVVNGQLSFEDILQQLEGKIVILYKAILLYQIKSVLSYYQHGSQVVFRSLVNLDNWDAELQSVYKAEATLKNDSDQFYNHVTNSSLRDLANSARDIQPYFGDIRLYTKDLLDMEMDEKNLQRLRELLASDPRLDKKRIERTKGGLLQESYRWILDNHNFREWRDEEWHDEGRHDQRQSRILWIQGNPGKGKTMLLCGIINELESEVAHGGVRKTQELSGASDADYQESTEREGQVAEQRESEKEEHSSDPPDSEPQENTSGGGGPSIQTAANLSFFFCQAGDLRINSATAVLRGLIYMLVAQQPSLVSHLRNRSQPFEGVNALEASSEVFENILQECGNTYLIVDALDECVTDRGPLLDLINKTSVSFRDHVKWIVSSRNRPEIEERLGKSSVKLLLEQNDEHISSAVSMYTEHKICGLVALKGYTPDMQNTIRQHLTKNAENTFLWVALVCQGLVHVPLWSVPKMLRESPPSLSSIYTRMLEDVCIFDVETDDGLYKRILSIVGISRRPITLTELSSLLDLPEWCSSQMKDMVERCGSFLTVEQCTVYFVHESAKEFILTEAADRIFPLGMHTVHHVIFSRSLNIMQENLKADMYGLGAPGFPIEKVVEPASNSLAAARYSCIYWIGHLCDSGSGDNELRTGGAVERFFKTRYTNWLEALSLSRSMPKGVFLMRELKVFASTSPLIGLINDARRFLLYFYNAIESSPLQAYVSALIFSPVGSSTRTQFVKDLPNWISLQPTMEANWNACLQTLEGHTGSVILIACPHDGQQMASASIARTALEDLITWRDVKFWDARNGVCLKTVEDFRDDSVESFAFKHDFKQIVTGTNSCVKIWDISSGACRQAFKGHNNPVTMVAFTSDDQLIISKSDNSIRIWDVISGECQKALNGNGFRIISFALSCNNQLVVLEEKERHGMNLRIFDVSSGKYQKFLEDLQDHITSTAISVNGGMVAFGTKDNKVKLWDADGSTTCPRTLHGHDGEVTSVAFSKDEKQVVSGSRDCTAKIWNVCSGECIMTLQGHSDIVLSAIFLHDGQVATGSHDRTVKIWDISSARSEIPESQQIIDLEGHTRSDLEGHIRSVLSMAFSPNGQLIGSGSADKTVKIWDACSGTCLRTLNGHDDIIQSVAFSHDGQLIASGSNDCNVRIWDASSGACLKRLEGHRDHVCSLAFSFGFTNYGEQLLASGAKDGIIRLWHVSSGFCFQKLEPLDFALTVSSLAFSQNGEQLISGDSIINLGDLEQVVSGSVNYGAKTWDVTSGHCLTTLESGNDSKSVAFSDDGRSVASAAPDGVVKIWDLSSRDCIQTLTVDHYVSSDTASLYGNTPQHQSSAQHQGYALSADRAWITCNGQNVLWLPQEYRPTDSCWHAGTNTVALGCGGGRVLIFRFSSTEPSLSL